MQIDKCRWCGAVRAAGVVILAGLVGGCVGQSEPAPVYLRGASEPPIIAPMPAPRLSPSPSLQVIVQRGRTLDGYAYTYHLPRSAIIAANGLRPPYELKAGQRLIIPNAHSRVREAMASPSAQPARPWSPPPQAAIPQPPHTPETIAMSAPASRPPQTISATPSAASPAAQPVVASAAPQQPAPPPPSAAKSMPEIIPLDGPPPAKEAEAAPPKPATLTPPRQQLAAPPATAAVSPAAMPARAAAPDNTQANAEPLPGGRFPWPVRGRVLAAYGNAPGGGHNDGINIAAPLGTPVRAVDSGTVVYSGNKVKGYGNIVLIRHANGWISAYAHLGDVGVKPGDTISAGEVIAKVGNSGGVAEPQLHFELRRGKKPVNPSEFLAPAPSAAGNEGNRAG